MKNIIAALLFCSSFSFAQGVIIGDNLGTATNKTSVLLEFSKAENRGIVLPYVKTLPANPAEGTILLDASNNTAARVKYYNGTWQDLTGDDAYVADVTNALANQPDTAENTDAKVIIGASSSVADGVLVLESTTKAMVLPTVASTNDIVNPAPGMLVYLSGDKMLAIYNGNKWSFWVAP